MNGTERNLDERAAQLLHRSDEERIAFLREDYWVGYPDATRILRRLGEVFFHPPSTRMPSVAIAGRPDNGKTSLIKRFTSMHPPKTSEHGVAIPVVQMRMPGNPDEAKIWTALLTQMMVSHRPNAMSRALQNQATRVLIEVRAKILVVDEFHHLLSSTVRAQEQVLAALKNLSTDLNLSLVAVGTREIIGALRVDPQMTSRFDAYSLRKWPMDSSLQRLLASIERHLPLHKASELSSPALATEIYKHSDGTIGGVTRTLRQASIEAISSGEEAVTLKSLKSVQRMTATQFAETMKDV